MAGTRQGGRRDWRGDRRSPDDCGGTTTGATRRGAWGRVADLARTAPIPVDVEASHDPAPATVEETAYFVACEALTNAVKLRVASSRVDAGARANGSLRLASQTTESAAPALARQGLWVSSIV